MHILISLAHILFYLLVFSLVFSHTDSERKVPEHHNRTTPKGHFGIFPNEVFSIVLSYLLNSDLSSLSLTSREMNAAVRDYSCTQQGCKHILHSMPPMVEGVGHLLSASPCLDENGFAFPFDPKQDSIMDVVKQFEDLGMGGYLQGRVRFKESGISKPFYGWLTSFSFLFF